jgi:FixJ family two-component response regulator
MDCPAALADALYQSRMQRDEWVLAPALRVEGSPGGRMPAGPLVSIVEDDSFLLASMKRLMRSLGFAVETFPSAAGLLESPRLADTGCLIADVNMPAMTGIELYRHLMKTGKPIPTILITAYPNELDRVNALNEGVLCYLRKPVDERELVRCLNAALPAEAPPPRPS